MDRRDEEILHHLNAAMALLKGKERSEGGRNPEWYRETGRLTDKGIEHLHAQFAKGRTSYAIAKEMKMSYRAVSVRHDEWRKKNPNMASWMRQDGR